MNEQPAFKEPGKHELTLLQRLNAVQKEVDYVQKEKKQGMRYSIVSHDAVTAKVRPLMVKHGVLYYPVRWHLSQNGNRTEGFGAVRFVSIDDKEDFIDVETGGYGIDDQDKGPGKAQSYAVKYALLKCLGLESGDDPDTDQETTHDSTLRKGLEMAIDLSSTLGELKEVGAQIANAAADLSPAETQLLKQRYTKRQTDLKTADHTA